MPQYKVTDPQSGHSLLLTGDSPPTEDELNQIFAGQQQVKPSPVLINSQSRPGLNNAQLGQLLGHQPNLGRPGYLQPFNSTAANFGLNMLGDVQSILQQTPTDKPTSSSDAIHNAAIHVAQGLASKTGAMTLPLVAIKPLQIPLMLAFGGLGAKNAYQIEKQVANNPNLTPPEKLEAHLDAGANAAMVVPGLLKGRELLNRPQPLAPPPRPGTPEYLDYVNKTVNPQILSRSPAKIAPPAASDSPVPIVSKTTTTNPLQQQNPAIVFQQQMRQQAAKMSPQELDAAYQQSKAKATQLGVAGNLNEAMQEATRGQFYREQLERLDALHSLKATAGALKYAQENKTLSPQEIQQFKQQGDNVFPLVEKNSSQAKQQAQQLYENIRQRNAAAGNANEEENVQEGQNGQEQNAAQGKAQTKVSQGLPGNARSNVGLDVKSTELLDDEKLGPRPSKALDKSWGEKGFVIAPKEMWDSLFNNRSAKVDPEQLYNRLRNKLGEASETFKTLSGLGLSSFLNQPRSVDEVQKWAEQNQPKVEVRKFGVENRVKTTEEIKLTDLQHNWFDSLNHETQQHVLQVAAGIKYGPKTQSRFSTDTLRQQKGQDFLDKAIEYGTLLRQVEQQVNERSTVNSAHWQSIAPKSEQDMPGYVEIAVVKPYTKTTGDEPVTVPYKGSGVQFPSSHSFPPNTLGFVRGYMETLPNGKKVFHVIEVQSDWAQQQREAKEQQGNLKEVNGPGTRSWSWVGRDGVPRGRHYNTKEEAMREVPEAIKRADDPLLKHYERLALKAAIDHARSEGADAIAISDAETAMMTEGHDRGYPYLSHQLIEPNGAVWDSFSTKEAALKEQQRHPSLQYEYEPLEVEQEQGMRLHYDQTLPKIAGELTGEKGEKVSFGEHKMALGDLRDTGEERGIRKDLIFLNENGSPKTDVSARMFPLAKAKKEFSLYGRTGAIFPKPTPRQGPARTLSQIAQAQQQGLVSKIGQAVAKATPEIHSFLTESAKPAGLSVINLLKGNALPYTTGVNQQVSNRLYNYAQAHAIADVLAKIDPDTVLGTKDPAFDKKLGGTLVEYNIRQLGQTSIGKQWSPFKTEQDYQNALKDPQIQAAIQRHNDIVLKDATQRHEALGGEKLDLPDQRMFVNLKYLPSKDLGRGAVGNLKATLQRKSATNQERKGTATEYETSYKAIADRMIRANYSENQRKLLNDEYVKQGLGKYVGPGEQIPDFGRHGAFEVPVRLQRAILLKEGESPSVVSQNKSLYIRKDLAPEYMQALGANPNIMGNGLRTAAAILTKVQVQLGVDAVQHTVNMLFAVDGVTRSQGYKNIIGAKEYDTLKRIVQNIANVQRDDPQTQQLLRQMAADYGIARPEHEFQGMFGGKSLGGRAISTVDKAGRLTLFQIAKELAAKGLIKDDPTEIRNFINKNLGQYNMKLQSAFNSFAKATFSPFIVAGKTFNRLAASRLLLSPGVKAANPQAWTEMRARQALYIATGLVVIPALLNYKFNGQAFPEDTKVGEIKLPDGKIIDMGRYTFVSRGERITGFGPVMDEQIMTRLRDEESAALGQTAVDSFTGIARGLAAPYAGPLINMVSSLLTGKSALGYQTSQPGEQYPYVKAAVRQANPILGAGMSDQPTTDFEKRLEQITGTRDTTPRSIINRSRRWFLYKHGKSQQDDFTSGQYVKLTADLLNNKVDDAKKDYQDLLKYEVGQHQDEGDPQHAALVTLQKHFEDYAKSHGQTSKAQEEAFVKTLTPHQKNLYDKALKQQQDVADLFFSQIQPKMSGNEPRGFRPPSIRRPRHFSY